MNVARRMMRCLLAIGLAGAQASAAQAKRPPVPPDASKLVDLTYSFDAGTIYWPTSQPFTWQKEAWGRADGRWYTAGRYSASEHGGTHIDAPIHFAEGGLTVDRIPLAKLVRAAVVIDISEACAKDPDYLLTERDITRWEARYGRLPDHSIVLIRTGWGRFWGDRKRYLGTDTPLDTAHLHFPGISEEAARLLALHRKADAVGIDTASLDRGSSTDFAAHQVLTGRGLYGLENVANLERLPARGAIVIALPMKIGGGTGAPVRIIAILP
jgi:kynurenine formamidase